MKHEANIVSLLNPKGGTGKSSLSLAIWAFFSQNHNALLIETDPQASLAKWGNIQGHEIGSMDILLSPTRLREAKTKYDIIIVDGKAGFDATLINTGKVSDLIVIPVIPHYFELEATSDLEAAISLVKAKKNVDACIALTSVRIGTRVTKKAHYNLSQIDIPVFETVVYQRQSHVDPLEHGKTVFDTTSTRAKSEISSLAHEIKERLNYETAKKIA